MGPPRRPQEARCACVSCAEGGGHELRYKVGLAREVAAGREARRALSQFFGPLRIDQFEMMPPRTQIALPSNVIVPFPGVAAATAMFQEWPPGDGSLM